VKKVFDGEDLAREKQELEAIRLRSLACFYQVQRRMKQVQGVA
jgi:hypothetical protein